MADDAFDSTLRQIAEHSLGLGELIAAVAALTEAGQASRAEQLYTAWIDSNSDSPQVFIALFNLGCLLTQAGNVAGAVESMKRAIALNPDFQPAYINLGGLVERAGAPDNAVELWRAGAARMPAVTGAAVDYKLALLKQITRVQADQHRMAEAEATLRECLALNTQPRDVIEQFVAMRMGQCKWPVLEPIERLDAQAQLSAMHPLSVVAYTDDPLLQLAAAARYVDEAVDDKAIPLDNDRRRAPIDLQARRLRIGYVSSDLREHAVGYLMSEVFELHDRTQIEVFAYYCGVPSSDAVNARIKGAVEHWVDISGMTDDQAAARIAADGVDILVDVNGHTRSARTGVFARRPAPIQVNWLGYPGTMGSPYHQFMVADDWIVPPEFELYYSEKVLRLPCYQPNDRKRIVAAQRPTRAEAGLPEDALVFCCFNASHKITRFTFDRWMDILKRVEGSVLWLLASGEDTHARLLAHAERAGVAAERIIFAPKMQNALHLARYPLADLSLDSVPYGAHTTASDALWMGVPVLTLSGRSFASRVCGSLVRAAGLAELACVDPQDFVERAVALGSDRAAIAALKARLEANRASCDLFNMEKLVASLEGLYRRMAEDHRLGALPRPDLSNLGDYFEVGTGLDHEGREMLARADYHDAYRQGLARRHDIRPIRSDRRVWTEADIAQADLGLAVAPVETPRPQAAPAPSEDPFDVAMTALIARNPKAFFVQVGGFDGVSFDPLRPHVVAGNLSGVIAEPIPQYFEKLQALYAGSSRVTPVNCAISDADGERTIWKFNPEAVERGLLPPHFAGISSFLMEDLLKETGVLGRSSPNAETTEALRTLVQPVSVPCLTLETLLTQRGVDQVDILQIDTEGYDYEILKLFDFKRFRPSVVHYEHQHLNAEDTAAAEALLRSHGYRVSRQTFDTTAVMDAPAASLEADGLRALALALGAEGRAADALLLLEHLNALRPSDPETLRGLVRALGQEGRTLEALAKLSALKLTIGDPEAVIDEIRAQALPAIERYNAHLAAGEISQAERYAAALADLAPQSPPMLAAALFCNQSLGRQDEVARYAQALLQVEPGHAGARDALAAIPKPEPQPTDDTARRVAAALSPDPSTHPLLRLRDLHDATSEILCRPLDATGEARVEQMLAAARALRIEVPAGSEWEAWVTHYRLLLDAVDLDAVRTPTPEDTLDACPEAATATGEPLAFAELRVRADSLGAQAVFFAAADEAYVDLYARWYALSVLKHADAPCLVVVHVIGGAGRLPQIARAVGVDDERLVFTADGFDAGAVTTEVHDAPPKGLIEKPVAHFQSIRFLRLGALLALLERPVFVSDIDLLLQRGVADLLARTAGDDVVFNENEGSWNAGSRLTANLLLVNPTANARMFLSFLRRYLESSLGKPAVTRWIDQAALLFARHHLVRQGDAPKIGYFDTASDINNVMYSSYQDHPFRFLSLYHGFDTSSLEGLDLDADDSPQDASREAGRRSA